MGVTFNQQKSELDTFLGYLQWTREALRQFPYSIVLWINKSIEVKLQKNAPDLVLGEEHPHVATSLNNLAALYQSQGKYEQAEPLYIQALDMQRRVLGEEHPHTNRVHDNFIDFLQEVIKANRVEELSDDSLTQSLLAEIRKG